MHQNYHKKKKKEKESTPLKMTINTWIVAHLVPRVFFLGVCGTHSSACGQQRAIKFLAACQQFAEQLRPWRIWFFSLGSWILLMKERKRKRKISRRKQSKLNFNKSYPVSALWAPYSMIIYHHTFTWSSCTQQTLADRICPNSIAFNKFQHPLISLLQTPNYI